MGFLEEILSFHHILHSSTLAKLRFKMVIRIENGDFLRFLRNDKNFQIPGLCKNYLINKFLVWKSALLHSFLHMGFVEEILSAHLMHSGSLTKLRFICYKNWKMAICLRIVEKF